MRLCVRQPRSRFVYTTFMGHVQFLPCSMLTFQACCCVMDALRARRSISTYASHMTQQRAHTNAHHLKRDAHSCDSVWIGSRRHVTTHDSCFSCLSRTANCTGCCCSRMAALSRKICACMSHTLLARAHEQHAQPMRSIDSAVREPAQFDTPDSS